MIVRTIAIVFLAVLLVFAIDYSRLHNVVQMTALSTDTGTTPNAFTANDFIETGTLAFYPNNVGPVPYLFYQNQKGSTVAKALVFTELPLTDFSPWSGAHISITGVVEHEHVVVTRIEYLSAP
jgi:hypothetical protein